MTTPTPTHTDLAAWLAEAAEAVTGIVTTEHATRARAPTSTPSSGRSPPGRR